MRGIVKAARVRIEKTRSTDSLFSKGTKYDITSLRPRAAITMYAIFSICGF